MILYNTLILALKMSNFLPDKRHLREALLFTFHFKKKATEAHQMLTDAYGGNSPSLRTCQEWYQQFKSGDFSVNDKDRPGQPKKFNDDELQSLLNEDDAQTQEQLAASLNVTRQAISLRLHAMGKIQKEGKWMPYQLTDRNKEQRKTIAEMLLQRFNRKSFLHRIVTGDEKWIYFDNPKRKRSWVNPGDLTTSTAKPNIHGKKVILCIWWDQQGVLYYELLQPGETVTANRYQQQLQQLRNQLSIKRPEWAHRHDEIILLHDNARPHVAQAVKDTINEFNWEVLSHPPYSPDIATSDYYLFRSMAHGLTEQRFQNHQDVRKRLDEWIASKETVFFYNGLHKLPILWNNVVVNDGNYF